MGRTPARTVGESLGQPNVIVRASGDVYEQDAERVAGEVMRWPAPPASEKCACGGQCSRCQTEGLRPGRQRMSTARVVSSGSGTLVAPTAVHEVLRVPGQPLDAATRAFMEPRFGHDFSRVRIHADEGAAESARALNALAYTYGTDIVFAAGRYQPASSQGRHLPSRRRPRPSRDF